VLDVIQFDESIERALLYALGPTLVCDTHKEAKKLCFTGGERHKMVSLDGTLISKSGIMTGGKYTTRGNYILLTILYYKLYYTTHYTIYYLRFTTVM
jgi:chromosome segregation ATPase